MKIITKETIRLTKREGGKKTFVYVPPGPVDVPKAIGEELIGKGKASLPGPVKEPSDQPAASDDGDVGGDGTDNTAGAEKEPGDQPDASDTDTGSDGDDNTATVDGLDGVAGSENNNNDGTQS